MVPSLTLPMTHLCRNPQNDLQAMARCHRIGQEKEVTVYRLISKDTYEEQLFGTASRKYGLDEAVLGGTGSGADSGDPEADAGRIARLLKHGAHGLVTEQQGQQGEAFQSEDIDQVGGDKNTLTTIDPDSCIPNLVFASLSRSWPVAQKRGRWAVRRETPFPLRLSLPGRNCQLALTILRTGRASCPRLFK